MGYTHFFRQSTSPIPLSAWKEFTKDVRKILKTYSVEDGFTGVHRLAFESDTPDVKPLVDNTIVRFNGIGDDGHETFMVERAPTAGFNFCKTQQKPYDVAVVACLYALKAEAPSYVSLSSDGSDSERQEGKDLYERATGKVAPPFE